MKDRECEDQHREADDDPHECCGFVDPPTPEQIERGRQRGATADSLARQADERDKMACLVRAFPHSEADILALRRSASALRAEARGARRAVPPSVLIRTRTGPRQPRGRTQRRQRSTSRGRDDGGSGGGEPPGELAAERAQAAVDELAARVEAIEALVRDLDASVGHLFSRIAQAISGGRL